MILLVQSIKKQIIYQESIFYVNLESLHGE